MTKEIFRNTDMDPMYKVSAQVSFYNPRRLT